MNDIKACDKALSNRMSNVLLISSVLFSIIALFYLWDVATQKYILDIIGRTLRVASIELSNGGAIYSSPALAMPYTPGYMLLNAFFIGIVGFSYELWNSIWAVNSLFFLVFFTVYFWKKARPLALIIPLSLLACLFPFIWARPDLLAINLLGLGTIIILDNQPNNLKKRQFIISALLFSAAIFTKQTMLPVIISVVFIFYNKQCVTREGVRSSLHFLLIVSLLFIVMMCLYMYAWNEDVKKVFAVLTLGSGHEIKVKNLFFYASMYFLVTLPPSLYVLIYCRKSIHRLVILHLGSASYILFSAKSGGGWHHFLVFVVPWLWLIADEIRSNKLQKYRNVLWQSMVILLLVAFYRFPFIPVKASTDDLLAIEELQLRVQKKDNNYVLFLDAPKGFVFPGHFYAKSGYRPLYERGALEEWSGTQKIILRELIKDIENGRFSEIYIRDGGRIGVTAYGVPYIKLYETIGQYYQKCSNEESKYWSVLCAL